MVFTLRVLTAVRQERAAWQAGVYGPFGHDALSQQSSSGADPVHFDHRTRCRHHRVTELRVDALLTTTASLRQGELTGLCKADQSPSNYQWRHSAAPVGNWRATAVLS